MSEQNQQAQPRNKYGDLYHEFTAYTSPKQITIFRNGKEWMKISTRVGGAETFPAKVTEIINALNAFGDKADTKRELAERKAEAIYASEELIALRRECRWLRQLVDTEAAALENLTRAMRDRG